MPFTSAGLGAIEAVIKTGELSVSYRGHEVTYRSFDEPRRARDFVKKSLQASSPDRLIPCRQVASFSDG